MYVQICIVKMTIKNIFSTAEELSIVIANRSAALNHLEQFEDGLDDIKRCLSLGYPRHLHYKVYERKARSLLVLKRNKEAKTAFQYAYFTHA